VTYRRKDGFYRMARSAGYRSRAAYKLLELSERHRLIRRGDHVVDLGAWPGGWLQVAADLVGPSGRVVGIDLQAVNPFPDPRIICLQGDVRDAAVREEVLRASARRVDVLLSDLAPHLTGVRSTDAARAAELAGVAIELACACLGPSGRVAVKTFMNSETDAVVAGMTAHFGRVRRVRPRATRSGSAEFYLIATEPLSHEAGMPGLL